MGNEFVSCSFLLLLLVMHAPGNAAGDHMEDAAAVTPNGVNNVLRLPGMDFAEQKEDVKLKHVHGENHDVKHSSSHMDMMDPSVTVFFVVKDLKVGKMLPIYFPYIDPSKSFHFLPREEADSIPFSSKALPDLLRFFSISRDSPQAIAMEQTLTQCESKAPKGEIKYCATSLESLTDFARSIFGSDSQVEILTTSQTTKSSPLRRNYTLLQLKEMTAPKMITCHSEPYPYAVYYCHTQESETKVFKVSLSGENGDRVDAVAVCHMDTSKWDPDHLSFRILGVKPGTSEVCHFFPADDLVVLPILPTL